MPDPLTIIGAGSAGLGVLKGLFGGGGGGGDIDVDQLLSTLRRNIIRTGGAAQKQNEAILRQNLAGASRLQAQNVLGQQQNRQLEALFNQLSTAEIQALQILLSAQSQNARLKLLQDQNLLSTLSGLGGSLGALTQKTPGTNNA